ncbi:MAG: folylpolyglutamate synthase/dihydrofolate synthase family protein [Erythrobacter sp.]
MLDFGNSEHPGVQAQLNRLSALSIQRDTLNLDAISKLLDRLGNPHKLLPPVFHVAGTNGKGSTCAFLRAILEAQGLRVHVTTSPHLVRYNERFRVAGELIGDDRLAELLEEVFDAAEGLDCSFFEITIAAAFTEFARVPADACVVEVGLGGRLDATNVLEQPAVCGIAALGLDHERFLLAPEAGTPDEPMARIAFEKVGIVKRGVPLIALRSGKLEREIIREQADKASAPFFVCGEEWNVASEAKTLLYSDGNGALRLPIPQLHGQHQSYNAALAVAMIRHQTSIHVDATAIETGMRNVSWPARLQKLTNGPLTGTRECWLDGGHNRNAGEMLGMHFSGQKVHLLIGMIEGKDPKSLIEPMHAVLESITAVPVTGRPSHNASAFGSNARDAKDLPTALAGLPDDGLPTLIGGSLYLAGEALKLNEEMPS